MNCSLEIKRGTVTGLIGKNGAGKTTVFKALLGLIRIDSGSIFYKGEERNSLGATEREHIGVVLAESFISAYLNAKDVCDILAKAYSTFDRQKFETYCRRFDIPMKKRIKEFSTGMKAKLKLISALCRVEGMTSISVSLNDKNTNVIMGDRIVNLWGRETIRDVVHMLNVDKEFSRIGSGGDASGKECLGGDDLDNVGQSDDNSLSDDTGITFEISPLSFYQVNPVQMEKLYSIALQYAGLTGKEDVWDLYCGIGTISLFLAKSARRVIGVEIIPEAIEDAKRNARNNGIENATFLVGKAEEVLPEYYANTISGSDGASDMLHPDVIVVDPPRKGCDIDCLETMLKMKPERIVYVSCDSATLARDLRILCDGGYSLKRFRPVDMFGHSGHVETVVSMTRTK